MEKRIMCRLGTWHDVSDTNREEQGDEYGEMGGGHHREPRQEGVPGAVLPRYPEDGRGREGAFR